MKIFFLLALFITKISANYVIEIAIHSWTNPFSAEFNLECCDSNSAFFPFCENSTCDTRFNFCLQPFSFASSNKNCPYGYFTSEHDPTINNSDNITFIVGRTLEGNVPNPLIFNNIPPEVDSFRFITVALEDDSGDFDDDFIDRITYYFDTSIVSSEFSAPVLVTGEFSVGTLEISHRVMCTPGYCGDCTTLCNDTLASICTTDTAATTTTAAATTNEINSSRAEDIMNILTYAIGGLCVFIVVLSLVTMITVCVCIHRRKQNEVTDTEKKPKFSNHEESANSNDLLVQSRFNRYQHSVSPTGDHISRSHSVISEANDSTYYASLSNNDGFYPKGPQQMHSNPAYSRSQTSLNQVDLTVSTT